MYLRVARQKWIQGLCYGASKKKSPTWRVIGKAKPTVEIQRHGEKKAKRPAHEGAWQEKFFKPSLQMT